MMTRSWGGLRARSTACVVASISELKCMARTVSCVRSPGKQSFQTGTPDWKCFEIRQRSASYTWNGCRPLDRNITRFILAYHHAARTCGTTA